MDQRSPIFTYRKLWEESPTLADGGDGSGHVSLTHCTMCKTNMKIPTGPHSIPRCSTYVRTVHHIVVRCHCRTPLRDSSSISSPAITRDLALRTLSSDFGLCGSLGKFPCWNVDQLAFPLLTSSSCQNDANLRERVATGPYPLYMLSELQR
ncbi:hypothetical protein K474DRAFT_1406408 [Panus rudis PR-1116 ss-1]|nr:hypothetical protein K474DRAFT_1406408 [Panus rudis PR-1116 ss-1]